MHVDVVLQADGGVTHTWYGVVRNGSVILRDLRSCAERELLTSTILGVGLAGDNRREAVISGHSSLAVLIDELLFRWGLMMLVDGEISSVLWAERISMLPVVKCFCVLCAVVVSRYLKVRPVLESECNTPKQLATVGLSF